MLDAPKHYAALMTSAKSKPRTIDEYRARAKPKQRAVLEKLRQTIHTIAPNLEEGISYGRAGFKLNGRPLVYFGAWANHCAFYPANAALAKEFQGQLKNFKMSKGTIRFTPDKPLPAALVRKLVEARIAENSAKERKKTTPTAAARNSVSEGAKGEAQSVLAMLKRLGNARIREEMCSRCGILTSNAFGVRMRDMQDVVKKLGRNHAPALALWETGNYEARIVAGFVAEPEHVTPSLMDRWCRDFDNWGIGGKVCSKLFELTPYAFGKVAQWAGRRDEFQKRAAFALLACVALHHQRADNEAFMKCLPLVERAASDERNFVKKGVSWALRALGERNGELNSKVLIVAHRLSASSHPATRWVGQDALRALTRPAALRRLTSPRRNSTPANTKDKLI